MLKINSLKLPCGLFVMILSASVLAQENTEDLLIDQQFALEQQVLDRQLALEQQEQLAQAQLQKQQANEQKLKTLFADLPLLFEAKIAQIYAENDYQPVWTNLDATRQFLADYTALVITGLSKQSWQQLVSIDAAEGLEKDLLLTDAFLSYLFFADNVKQFAQQWLYDERRYPVNLPEEKRIDAWLSAVNSGKNLSFLTALRSQNPLYQETLAALPNFLANLDTKEKVLQLYKMAINAQRLSIIPDFKNGLFVNIPSYQLSYYRDGKLVLQSKVIVGKKARKTPVMYSKLSNLVVNPPWNTPERLINEDIIPKVRKDPSYIYRNGYLIIDKKGRTVDPYTIDWENMTAKKFPYRLRQVPGDSALGDFKFNMPSSDAIYLHDTPVRSYFAKKNRALSSGCVRVEKSNQLATILLKEAGWTEERKNDTLKSRKTVSVNITSDNPVFLYYVTNWVENGAIQKLPDIYEYDKLPPLEYIQWDLVRKYLQ